MMDVRPAENYEQWVNMRDMALYTRPAIPFNVSDISVYESHTLMRKWCDVTKTAESAFDANKRYRFLWGWSEHEHADWIISQSRPFMYTWGTKIRPLGETQTRELILRRRHVTLRQLATYDLSHPLLNPAPKQLDKKVLQLLTGQYFKWHDDLIIYPRASVSISVGESLDFYDVVDVIYALNMRHLSGRFDLSHIEHFWKQRREAYHIADCGKIG